MLLCSRYIELNPVRTKLVADTAEYPRSSYQWHTFGKSDPLITDHRQKFQSDPYLLYRMTEAFIQEK